MDQNLVFVIDCIIGIIIIAGLVLYLKKKKDSKAVDKFLESLLYDIQKILLEEAKNCIILIQQNEFKDVEAFKLYVIKQSSSSVWVVVSNNLVKASSENLIPKFVCKIVTREYVDEFVKIAIDKFELGEDIKAIYNENIVESSKESMIEKDNELSKKFDDNEYFENEELDNSELIKESFDDSSASTYKRMIGDNELEDIKEKEIVPPVYDGNVEEVYEEVDDNGLIDGLTEEEINAGIHFNKAGRKIDSTGKFVK